MCHLLMFAMCAGKSVALLHTYHQTVHTGFMITGRIIIMIISFNTKDASPLISMKSVNNNSEQESVWHPTGQGAVLTYCL